MPYKQLKRIYEGMCQFIENRKNNKKRKGLYDELCQVVVNRKREVISGSDLWVLYHKYVEYQNSKEERDDNYDDHKILYFLLEKLYVANCNDSDLVSAVIRRFDTENIWYNGIISDLFNETNNFETDEIIELLEYCLKYAYKKKMLFDEMRLALLMHFFELLLPKSYYIPYLPKIVGIFLRYGMLLNPITGEAPSFTDAFSLCDSEDLPYATEMCNSNWILLWHSIITEGIILHNPKLLPLSELPNEQKQIINICVEIANMFMRDSVRFKLSDFYSSVAKQEFFEANPLNPNRLELFWFTISRVQEFSPINAVDFIQNLGRFIPELPRRCFEPLTLKCSCKQNIRKILHLNWQLPFGIFKLDVPESLIRYLNLEID